MRAYRYVAKVGPAKRVEGVIQGDSSTGVARSLVARGMFPVEVVEAGTPAFKQMSRWIK